MKVAKERVLELLTYSQDTGLFYWKESGRGRTLNKPQGSKTSHGYLRITIDGVEYLQHRLVWLVETGGFPKEFIDHIDRVRDNNVFSNLREATHQENNRNRGDNTSGHVGVSFNTIEGKWVQQLRTKEVIDISKHQTLEQAVQARKSMEAKYL